VVIGEGRHGGADWTAAMVPTGRTLLERIAADTEQLAVLDDVLSRWDRRARIDLDTVVEQAWYDDPGARGSVELGMRARLLDQADDRWPGALVLRPQLAWTRAGSGSWSCSITALVLPEPVPDAPTDAIPVVHPTGDPTAPTD
jgi:hypothetical protein